MYFIIDDVEPNLIFGSNSDLYINKYKYELLNIGIILHIKCFLPLINVKLPFIYVLGYHFQSIIFCGPLKRLMTLFKLNKFMLSNYCVNTNKYMD